MTQKNKSKILATMFTVGTVIPYFVSAQGLRNAAGALSGVASQAGLEGQTDLATIIGGIIQAGLSLVGLIFFILMVYAGYNWMIARGDEGRVEKAKDTIRNSIIGIIIVILAYSITTFVTSRLSNL